MVLFAIMMKLIESRFLRSSDYNYWSLEPKGCLDGEFQC